MSYNQLINKLTEACDSLNDLKFSRLMSIAMRGYCKVQIVKEIEYYEEIIYLMSQKLKLFHHLHQCEKDFQNYCTAKESIILKNKIDYLNRYLNLN